MEKLPSVARLSEHVVRILGQNPGKFTLQGTNTYLVGRQNPYILIDTGEAGKDAYISQLSVALQTVAKPLQATEPDVSDIVITHKHHDHVGGLPAVLALLRRRWDARNPSLSFQPPRLHKYPLPHAPPPDDRHLKPTLDALQTDSYAPSPSGSPFHDLANDQLLPSASSPDMQESSLRILHTPGHTADSICLYLPVDRALFTADTVLGGNTSVFEDLSSYLSSLRHMLAFRDDSDRGSAPLYDRLYPGHGPVVADGRELIDMYITHRLEREKQVIEVLKGAPRPGTNTWTVWDIVGVMYAVFPKNLWEPAANGIELHLQKLHKEGRVELLGGQGHDSRWQLLEDD